MGYLQQSLALCFCYRDENGENSTTVNIPWLKISDIITDDAKILTIYYEDDTMKHEFKVANRSHADDSWKTVLENYKQSILAKLLAIDESLYNNVLANKAHEGN